MLLLLVGQAPLLGGVPLPEGVMCAAKAVVEGLAPLLPTDRRELASFLKAKEGVGVEVMLPRSVSLAGVVQTLNDRSHLPFSNLGPVGGCLAAFAEAWTARETDPWVTQVITEGYRIPWEARPPHLSVPSSLPASYPPCSVKGLALAKEVQAILSKEAIEEVPRASKGVLNTFFVVPKPGESEWRPILDLSVLNKNIVQTRFKMLTCNQVLNSLREGDWMMKLDLKDAYLQIPIHPSSKPFLQFSFEGKRFQFRVLPFGLTTAPMVFTRVMATVASLLYQLGVRILLYLAIG